MVLTENDLPVRLWKEVQEMLRRGDGELNLEVQELKPKRSQS